MPFRRVETMNAIELRSHNPNQTQLLGTCIGKLAQKADVFLLVGELGTGKTCLAQGIACGLEATEHVFSPSFVILREYRGRLPLYHIDLYRLDRIEEIADLGLEDYLYGDGVCVVEWADRCLQLLPKDNLLISLRYVPASPTVRSIRLEPQGQRYRALVEQLPKKTTV